MLKGHGHRFGATVNMELVINILQMFFYGVDGDIGLIGDHFIRISLHQNFKYLFLAFGKLE